MKNPLYTWLTPLLTVLITVLGFVLLRPEETTALYWINMSYLIVLETLFFGWFEVGRWKNTQTNYFSVFWGVHALYYIAGSLLWMGLYSLLLYRWASLTVYGIGIGMLTLGWPSPSLSWDGRMLHTMRNRHAWKKTRRMCATW